MVLVIFCIKIQYTTVIMQPLFSWVSFSLSTGLTMRCVRPLTLIVLLCVAAVCNGALHRLRGCPVACSSDDASSCGSESKSSCGCSSPSPGGECANNDEEQDCTECVKDESEPGVCPCDPPKANEFGVCTHCKNDPCKAVGMLQDDKVRAMYRSLDKCDVQRGGEKIAKNLFQKAVADALHEKVEEKEYLEGLQCKEDLEKEESEQDKQREWLIRHQLETLQKMHEFHLKEQVWAARKKVDKERQEKVRQMQCRQKMKNEVMDEVAKRIAKRKRLAIDKEDVFTPEQLYKDCDEMRQSPPQTLIMHRYPNRALPYRQFRG